jgi:hypothetical protein
MPEKPFRIPDEFLKKLLELTGSSDRHKGFMLFCFDANGTFCPIMLIKDKPMELALTKGIERWLNYVEDSSGFSPQEEEMD